MRRIYRNIARCIVGCVCGAAVALMFASCSSDDLNDTSVIKDTPQNKTSFDTWLDQNFKQEYNIRLKYRLEDVETNFTYTLVPAEVDNSVKLSHIILHTWLKAYDEVAGESFTRRLAPKIIQFVGSVAWQTDNTAIMGQAEDGMKITLFGVNQLVLTRSFLNANYFQSMHHEFTHIMTQSKDYDPDFQKISEGKYEPAEWYSSGHNTETYALQKGFISSYAMSEYNEDFAEMLAFYLIYTQDEWDSKMKTADAAYVEGSGLKKPSEIIGQKLSMVRNYMLSAWNIDIQKLRTVVQRRMDEVVNGSVNLEEM